MAPSITRQRSGIEFSARDEKRARYRHARAKEGVKRALEVDWTPRNRRRKKPKYTRGTKRGQKMAYGLTKSAERSALAVAHGLFKFNVRSKVSRWRRRDGAVIDGAKNAAKGLDVGLRELGKAPRHVAKQVPTRWLWKGSRRAATLLGAPIAGLFR